MKTKLFNLISDQIGIEPEEISPEDSLREDLHMSSSDLAELAEKIASEKLGIVDFSEIETIEELIDQLNLEEEI